MRLGKKKIKEKKVAKNVINSKRVTWLPPRKIPLKPLMWSFKKVEQRSLIKTKAKNIFLRSFAIIVIRSAII